MKYLILFLYDYDYGYIFLYLVDNFNNKIIF